MISGVKLLAPERAEGTSITILSDAPQRRLEPLIAGIAVLCLVDMWMVNKRYLYDDMFVDKIERDAPQQMTETDTAILGIENRKTAVTRFKVKFFLIKMIVRNMCFAINA